VAHLLLESPLKLAILELAVALVLLWLVRRRAWPAARVLGGYLLLCVALLAVQYVVVTDAEKIRRVMHEMADAVDFGHVEVIESHLADDFVAWRYDREQFMELVHQHLETYRIDEVWVGGEEIQIERDQAQIEFTARARIGTEELGSQPYMERWRMTLRPEGEEWRVTRVENLGWQGAPSVFQPAR
jgi:hypothetical protein